MAPNTRHGAQCCDDETGLHFIRFPGQYFDAETGLHYNYHRYYGPGIGRYVSADPIGQFGLTSGIDPMPFPFSSGTSALVLAGGDSNRYPYVLNNPVNLIDPNGELAFIPALGIALAAATGIGVGVPLAISEGLEALGLVPADASEEVAEAAEFVADVNLAIFTGASAAAGAAAVCEAGAAGFANPEANNQAAAFLSGLAGGPAPGVGGAAGRMTRAAVNQLLR